MRRIKIVRRGNPHLVPVLGTVGGTAEQSRATARNIEAFMKRGLAAQRAVDRTIRKANHAQSK